MATGHNETDTPEAQFLAHQLMQPVMAADNYAAALLELLHGGRLTPEKLEEGLAKIKSQTEKALGTAKALRALTRAQTTAAGRALFSEAFKAGLTRVQTLFPAFSCPAEGLCGTNVVCDPVLLEELLFNLLKNAAEAASDTGSSKARAAVTVSGGTLVFTLTNPVADADEAFTAAQGPAAANRKKGGSGTGLIVVRRILEACRGRLSLTALSEGQFSATVTFCVAGYSPRTVSNKN